MRVVIYARYSSHSQTEQSIEGQLQVILLMVCLCISLTDSPVTVMTVQ